jgi:hypothetical protein
MNLVFKKLVVGGLLFGQTLLLAQNDADAVKHLYLEYGYNLPAAKSLTPSDLSPNVNRCLATENETQKFYCIVGVTLKASKEELPSQEDMSSLNFEQYRAYVPQIVQTVQESDTYEAKKKADEQAQREDKIARQNYSSNYFVGLHSENFSEFGFHVGYAKSLDDPRYSVYYTKHTFEDYGKDLGANELGVTLLYPFSFLKFNNIYPHAVVGLGYIAVSESGYDGGVDIYFDLGFDYNINESFEVILNARVFDEITLLSYSSTGVNLSLNYWF